MNKIQIRTSKKEGSAPLYMRIKIEEKATWVSLLLQVDIQKWKAAAGSERKIINLLDKLDYTRKIQEIEFAIKDLRKRHRLPKESAASAIDSVSLAEGRAALLKKEEQKEKVVRTFKYSFRNCLDYYVNSAIEGTRRHSYGESFAHYSQNLSAVEEKRNAVDGFYFARVRKERGP